MQDLQRRRSAPLFSLGLLRIGSTVMKKLLLIPLLAPHLAIGSQYPPTTVDMELKRVSEHVYHVRGAAGIATDNQGFISNAIVTSEGLVIVGSVTFSVGMESGPNARNVRPGRLQPT